VKAEAKGFKSLEQTGITLTVMEAAHLDLPLSIGEATADDCGAADCETGLRSGKAPARPYRKAL
jgi:hypothetical protein